MLQRGWSGVCEVHAMRYATERLHGAWSGIPAAARESFTLQAFRHDTDIVQVYVYFLVPIPS